MLSIVLILIFKITETIVYRAYRLHSLALCIERTLIQDTCSDLMVLARCYMQILSPELSAILRGARSTFTTPSCQTSRVRSPIIKQVVERVDHSCDLDQLLATGRDMECLALSRAVKFQIECMVFLNGNRTVVLR